MTEKPELLSSEDVEKLKEALNHAAATPAAASLLGLPSIDLSGLSKVRGTLTEIVSALDLVLKYKAFIPDQYEGALTSLDAALKKVLDWIPA